MEDERNENLFGKRLSMSHTLSMRYDIFKCKRACAKSRKGISSFFFFLHLAHQEVNTFNPAYILLLSLFSSCVSLSLSRDALTSIYEKYKANAFLSTVDAFSKRTSNESLYIYCMYPLVGIERTSFFFFANPRGYVLRDVVCFCMSTKYNKKTRIFFLYLLKKQCS